MILGIVQRGLIRQVFVFTSGSVQVCEGRWGEGGVSCGVWWDCMVGWLHVVLPWAVGLGRGGGELGGGNSNMGGE